MGQPRQPKEEGEKEKREERNRSDFGPTSHKPEPACFSSCSPSRPVCHPPKLTRLFQAEPEEAVSRPVIPLSPVNLPPLFFFFLFLF